jgi:thioredoxin reductase
VKRVDVAVIGAGPAGIAAALAAASAGAQTAIIDEQPAVGGSLRWRIASIADLPGAYRDLSGLPGVRLASALADRLGATKVEITTGGVAWGWFEGNILGVLSASDSYELQARSIVVASGSTDIMAPFIGSTLPGVMTARAVLTFLHLHRVFPGRRFAVIGSGADAAEVADAIATAGAEVVCRVDGVDGLRVSGDGRVERIEFPGGKHKVDCVVVALSRQPGPELALQALAENVLVPAAGGFVPLRNLDCETSTPGLYVAGDAAGIVSDAEAFAEGQLAGLAAAGAGEAQIAAAREELAAMRGAERLATIDRLRLRVEA